MFPVRCFTCGKVIGHLWEWYKSMTIDYGLSEYYILDSIGISKACCRRMFITHVDNMDELLLYDDSISMRD